VVLRSYEIKITVQSPVTIEVADGVDSEALFRFLADLVSEASVELDRVAKQRFKAMEEEAAKAGVSLKIPDLRHPMGVSSGVSDVTSQVGRRWTRQRKDDQ
jgi:hypothetical protein